MFFQASGAFLTPCLTIFFLNFKEWALLIETDKT